MARTLKTVEGPTSVELDPADAETLRNVLQQLSQARLITSGILFNIEKKYRVSIDPEFNLDDNTLTWNANENNQDS